MSDQYKNSLPEELRRLDLTEKEAGNLYVLWTKAIRFDQWIIPTWDYMIVQSSSYMSQLLERLEKFDLPVQWAFLEALRNEAKEAGKLEFFEELRDIVGDPKVQSKVEIVLYYYYLRRRSDSPFFGNSNENAFGIIAEREGISRSYVRKIYYKVTRHEYRRNPNRKQNIKNVIQMLRDFPEERKEAEEDLNAE